MIRNTKEAASNPNTRRSLYYVNIIFLSFLTILSLAFAMFIFFRPWVGNKEGRERLYSELEIDELKRAAASEGQKELLSQMQTSLESGEGALVALRKAFQDRIVAERDGRYWFFPVAEQVEKNPFDADAFLFREEKVFYTSANPAVSITDGACLSDDNGRIDWDRLADGGLREVMISIGSVTAQGFTPDEQADRNCRKAVQKGIRAGLSIIIREAAPEQVLEEAQALAVSLAAKYPSLSGQEAEKDAGQMEKSLSGAEVLVCTGPRDAERPKEKAAGYYNPDTNELSASDYDEGEKDAWTGTVSLLCEKIEESGGQPVLGMSLFACGACLDMEKAAGYQRWIIDDESKPVFPYSFQFWEYKEDGHVNGVPGLCPLYIRLERSK